MKKLGLPILAVGALCFAGLSIYRTQLDLPKTEPPHAPPKSSFAGRIAAAGLVEANTENIAIGAHLSGVVERVFVTAGQRVERGSALIRLDTRQLEAALEKARADFAARSADAETARARVGIMEARAGEARELLRIVREAGTRSVATEEVTRRSRAAESFVAELAAARASVTAADAATKSAEAGARQIETDIARSTVNAPVAGTVLQVNLRPGEFVAAGAGSPTWLLLGNLEPLHVRVDVDEHEAWRIQPTAAAEGQVRGNAQLRARLRFVRFEPYILPKRSLTGDAAERVDTRVLQVIYAIEKTDASLFVGQQMDVFIADAESAAAVTELTSSR